LANLAYAEGDFATAAQQYEKVLAIEETSSAHDYAGQAYLQLGDLPNAFRHLQAAAASDPGNADLAARLAAVANWLNRLDDAAVVVDGALRLRPDDPNLYFMRAQLDFARSRGGYAACRRPAAGEQPVCGRTRRLPLGGRSG
jgi:tetratricopeptide (TPR) repeat protein